MRRSMKQLCCAVLAAWLVALTPLAVSAETVEEIQAQQQQLEEENQALNTKLESLREDEAQKQAYQETLQEQIDVVQQQILTTRENIQQLNASIQELTLKLEASQKEVQDTIDAFKERLVVLYTAGSVSTLEILLDASSLSEFTTRMSMLDAMTARDQELVDKLEAYIASTQADRDQCQAEKEEVAALQVTLEDKEKELDSLYEENKAALGEVQGQRYATENLLEANEKELAEGEARIQAAIAAQKKAEEEAKQQAANNPPANSNESNSAPDGSSPSEDNGGDSDSTTSPSDGGDSSPETSPETTVTPSEDGGSGAGIRLTWPMPGVTYVSCPYGGYPGHKGMDIAGAWGTPIVAAADGLVIDANATDSWGYSWGYYVLIYHNGTYSTRYAHLSSVAVSNGQYVTAGTIIGYEGETGNAFGAHLHFEVYENNVRVDPAQFL